MFKYLYFGHTITNISIFGEKSHDPLNIPHCKFDKGMNVLLFLTWNCDKEVFRIFKFQFWMLTKVTMELFSLIFGKKIHFDIFFKQKLHFKTFFLHFYSPLENCDDSKNCFQRRQFDPDIFSLLQKKKNFDKTKRRKKIVHFLYFPFWYRFL